MKTTNRRSMLTMAGAAVAAAGTATLISAPTASASTPPSGIVFNVRDYGATGNGSTSDTAAIQAAINAAAGSGAVGDGGVVWFPAGRYKITNPGLVITNTVTLQGVGWNDFNGANPLVGSWLIVVSGGGSYNAITINGRPASGTQVRDLAFDHIQPAYTSGWVPDPTFLDTILITNSATSVVVDHVMMLRPTRGIHVTTGDKFTFREIYGEPSMYGIWVETATDVCRIENIHFWAFYTHYVPAANTVVRPYNMASGTAIKIERFDNGHLSNIFGFGYRTGLLMGGPAGAVSKLHVNNADFDSCGTGLWVNDGSDGYITNFTTQNVANPTTGCALYLPGNSSRVLMSNVGISTSAQNAIRIGGTGVTLGINNLYIDKWDQLTQGFPAIEIAGTGTNSRVVLSGAKIFGTGGNTVKTKVGAGTGGSITAPAEAAFS